MAKEKKAKRSVTLKRTVTIKAIVTDKFKQYMNFEIQTGIQNSTKRIDVINKGLAELTNIDSSKTTEGHSVIKQQLEAELVQLEHTIKDLEKRKGEVENLEMDSKFTQGTVDGFVTVSEGDNLYEKVGGMEIVVKDGVIDKIVPIAELPQMPEQ